MNKKHQFLAGPNPTHYKMKNSDPNPTQSNPWVDLTHVHLRAGHLVSFRAHVNLPYRIVSYKEHKPGVSCPTYSIVKHKPGFFLLQLRKFLCTCCQRRCENPAVCVSRDEYCAHYKTLYKCPVLISILICMSCAP